MVDEVRVIDGVNSFAEPLDNPGNAPVLPEFLVPPLFGPRPRVVISPR